MAKADPFTQQRSEAMAARNHPRSDPVAELSQPTALRQRLIGATVLIPVVSVLLLAGGRVWAGAVGVALLIAGWEYQRLMASTGLRPQPGWIALLIIAFVIAPLFPSLALAEIALTVVPSLALVWQWLVRPSPHPTAEWGLSLAGGLYLGWLGHFLVLLRLPADPVGRLWTAFALLVTWAADSGAYLVGSRWGRHRIIPRLSPGKTWEGYLGGWMIAVAVGTILAWLFFGQPGHGAVLGGLIGSLSILGDLSVSMMKRDAGVKDSGHLIPGHGGVLDRIDSLLWSGMIVYVYGRLFF